MLKKYPSSPEAVSAVAALESVAGEPIPIFTNDYHQTAASVGEAVADAKDNGRQMRLAETLIPNGLLLAGGLLVLAGLLLLLIPKHRKEAVLVAPAPEKVVPVPDAVPVDATAVAHRQDRESTLV